MSDTAGGGGGGGGNRRLGGGGGGGGVNQLLSGVGRVKFCVSIEISRTKKAYVI